jgi:hypothetical protein
MGHAPIDADTFRNFERAAHDEIAEGYRDFFAMVTDYAIGLCSTRRRWVGALAS